MSTIVPGFNKYAMVSGLTTYMEDDPPPIEDDIETHDEGTDGVDDVIEISEIKSDINETASDLKYKYLQLNQILNDYVRMVKLHNHVRINGISTEFLKLYNSEGELDSTLNVLMPSCESFDMNTRIPDNLVVAACEGFTDVISKIGEYIKKFFSWIWESIKKIGTKIKNFFARIFGLNKDSEKAMDETAPADADEDELSSGRYSYLDSPTIKGKLIAALCSPRATMSELRAARKQHMADIDECTRKLNGMLNRMKTAVSDAERDFKSVKNGLDGATKIIRSSLDEVAKVKIFSAKSPTSTHIENIQRESENVTKRLEALRATRVAIDEIVKERKDMEEVINALFKEELKPIIELHTKLAADSQKVCDTAEASLKTCGESIRDIQNIFNRNAKRLENSKDATTKEFASAVSAAIKLLQSVSNECLSNINVLAAELGAMSTVINRRVERNRSHFRNAVDATVRGLRKGRDDIKTKLEKLRKKKK